MAKTSKYIEHIYHYRLKQMYNFEVLQNLHDLSDEYYLKYYHIVNNIHEDWKALLKEENLLTEEPNKQTKILNILNTKQYRIAKCLYSTLIQAQDNNNKKSEINEQTNFQIKISFGTLHT